MVTLIILDGFGIRKKAFGNAVISAGTPNLDKLKERYFYTTLKASGNAVGLPKGQMGNSEVGHLTLGSGRVILQDLMRIDDEIKSKNFFKNEKLIKAIKHAKDNNSSLHIMGLLSDGGVHSHINHLFAILDLAEKNNLEKVFVHAFTDGRDTPINSGENFVGALEEKIKNTPFKLASLCGRVFAMDRERRFDRIQKAYNTIVFGENFQNKTPLEAIKEISERGKLPVVVGGTGFYIQSVLYQIDFKENDDNHRIRLELENFAKENGSEALHLRLKEVDPEAAVQIHHTSAADAGDCNASDTGGRKNFQRRF